MRAMLFFFACAGLLLACSGDPGDAGRANTAHPWIVVGVDGGEWSVIRELWDEGRLPNLRRVAERGTTAVLRTDFDASPVIWTTVATGMRPAEHGITGFVVATEGGDVPVSSAVRRVPALWNMLSRAHRRVAVLGWWASWPAEDVAGVVVSDRAWLGVERAVSPESFAERFAIAQEDAKAEENAFGGGNEQTRERDHGVAHLARQLATEGYDLLLVYFRGVDIASHNSWRCFRPGDFDEDGPPASEGCRDRIPREYEAVDAALGRILAAAPDDANVLVISDHGFGPAKHEIVKVLLDLDEVLERLGLLSRRADGTVDRERSAVYTYASPVYRALKQVRFGGAASAGTRAELEAALARVAFQGEDGLVPAFHVRNVRGREDGDAVVRVHVRSATETLLLDGDPRPLAGLVGPVRRISGTHGARTHGILLAAGGDVEPGADVDGITIYDIAPTLLYGLGLPVAENFAGSPRLELFTERYRRRHPVRTIAAWALPRDGDVVTSEADEEIVRELGALGYLD